MSQGKRQEVAFKRKKTKNNLHQILQRRMKKNFSRQQYCQIGETHVYRVNWPTLLNPGEGIKIKQRDIFSVEMTIWYRCCQRDHWNFGPAEDAEHTFFLIQGNQGKQVSDRGVGWVVLEWEHVPVDTLWVLYVMLNLNLCVWEKQCCWHPGNYYCNYCNFTSLSKFCTSLAHHRDAQGISGPKAWEEKGKKSHIKQHTPQIVQGAVSVLVNLQL